MNRAAQAVILTAIGGVALRVGITDEYTRYINEWMRWPLVASGVLVVALAFTVLFREYDGDHPTSSAAWALVLPIVVAFVVQPAALGGYVAERRVNDVAAVSYDGAAIAPLPEGEVTDMLVGEFVSVAATYSEVLEGGGEVRLKGFVTSDGDGWYLTRLSIRCCAADASAFRVQIDGADAPPDDQWISVVGAWVPGTGEGLDAKEPPALTATSVEQVSAPKHQYE